MNKNSIPANAHNGVVAGENAKVMTVEILEGFVADATKCHIDILVDAAWDCPQSKGKISAILGDVEEMCKDEGYDIDLDDWCEENDISLIDMIIDAADEIVEKMIIWRVNVQVGFTPMKTQFEWFFDEETMLEEDGDGSLIVSKKKV